MPTPGAIVNVIWRFYTDDSQRWKWQQLSVGREVITESATAYKEYEGCVADAKSKGYVFRPSQARLAPGVVHIASAANRRRGKPPG